MATRVIAGQKLRDLDLPGWQESVTAGRVPSRRELLEQPLSLRKEVASDRGELETLRRAIDQLHADLLLEPRDLLRDGGLGVVERLGGGGEGASQRDLAQDAQQAEIVHNETLSRGSSTII